VSRDWSTESCWYEDGPEKHLSLHRRRFDVYHDLPLAMHVCSTLPETVVGWD